MKSIVVFCGSQMPTSEKIILQTQALGRILAQNQIRLVYGGTSCGLMGVLAKAFLENGGNVIGVLPRSLSQKEKPYEGLSELILVDSLSERKNLMWKLSNMALALPGGFGTIDELFEILTLRQLKEVDHPVLVWNMEDYFTFLKKQVEWMQSTKFVAAATAQILEFYSSLEEIDSRLTELANN